MINDPPIVIQNKQGAIILHTEQTTESQFNSQLSGSVTTNTNQNTAKTQSHGVTWCNLKTQYRLPKSYNMIINTIPEFERKNHSSPVADPRLSDKLSPTKEQ